MNQARLIDALDLLVKSEDVSEAVVLSTCMRTEVYVDAVRFHPALEHIVEVVAQVSDLSVAEVMDEVFEFHDEEAYAHLFRVAAGLDSAVLGETEVLGQVARAWDGARSHGTCRSGLGSLFRHAVGVGKRARSETSIARGITSIGQAAVVMAGDHLDGLADKRTLILGAGEMGDSMAATLSRVGGIGPIDIANRTALRAQQLAARIGANAIDWNEVDEAILNADLVLTSTGSLQPILTRSAVESLMRLREGRPLVIVDVAVPHDVDPDAGTIEGVNRLDLNDLRVFTARGRADREREAQAVEMIVEEEVIAYCADANSRLVAPVVTALRSRAEAIRTSELERHAARLRDLDDDQREAVHALTKSMLSKLLHDPTVRLKDAAGTSQGDRMAETLRVLFGV